MITGAEVLQALPVIASLIALESLLSVDNALAVAAMASHLPRAQRRLALRLGIIGAYVFRGVALALAAWIVRNPWIKIAGALYLIYLMCSNLTARPGADGAGAGAKKQGLFLTILRIEILDLSLSLDNVIAAVAMSPRLWVVCTGVFIGILALRFLAGYCLRLLERFPALGPAAFLLVGWVGALLSYELISGTEVSPLPKFIGIALILTMALLYGRRGIVYAAVHPVVRLARPLMAAFAFMVDLAAWPLRKLTVWIAAVVERLAARLGGA